jgi:hypothetical protein
MPKRYKSTPGQIVDQWLMGGPFPTEWPYAVRETTLRLYR